MIITNRVEWFFLLLAALFVAGILAKIDQDEDTAVKIRNHSALICYNDGNKIQVTDYIIINSNLSFPYIKDNFNNRVYSASECY